MPTDQKWNLKSIPDLANKIAIVTGANSGIGYETSRALAYKRARVVIASRSRSKGESAARRISEENPQANLVVSKLDLADLQSVHRFSDEFLSQFDSLDLLINNAGVMATPNRKTADGFELQMGTNHLGHFALTGFLLQPLLSTKDSRIITISSVVHLIGRFNFFDLNSANFYFSWLAYGKSKLANLYFAYELQRRLESIGSSTISLAAHPGYASTNLQKDTFFNFLNPLFAQNQEMGALPTLYAATSPEAKGGDFITPENFFQQRGFPKKSKSSKGSYYEENAKRLWIESERMTSVRYEFSSTNNA